MNKIIKIISSILAILGFIGFLAVGYYAKQENPTAIAQEFSKLKCAGPIIPNGDVTEDTIELLDVVFQEYQKVAMDVQIALGHAQSIWASLSQSEGVCDFSKCQPQMANNDPGKTSNVAPDFFLRLNAYIVKAQVGIRPPVCSPTEAVGDPCSLEGIEESISQLYNLRTSFAPRYEIIHNLFLTPSEKVTEDTRIKDMDYLGRQEEGVGDEITRQEEIYRKIEAVTVLTDICSSSNLERKLVKEGKLGDKTVKKCIDALHEGAYEMPQPWSEMCKVECSPGATDKCIECLGRCEGTSVLAKLNCRIYGTDATVIPTNKKNCSNGVDPSCCGNVCGSSSSYGNPACNECLSRGLPSDEFERFLCGGSHKNWICCSAVPLK